MNWDWVKWWWWGVGLGVASFMLHEMEELSWLGRAVRGRHSQGIGLRTSMLAA